MNALRNLAKDIHGMRNLKNHVFTDTIILHFGNKVSDDAINASNRELSTFEQRKFCFPDKKALKEICSGATDLPKVLYALYMYLWSRDLHETRALLNALGTKNGIVWGEIGFFFPNFFTTPNTSVDLHESIVQSLVKDIIHILETATLLKTYEQGIEFLRAPWRELKDALKGSYDHADMWVSYVLSSHSLSIVLEGTSSYVSWEELLHDYQDAVTDNGTKGITDEAFAVVKALQDGVKISAAHATAKST